MTALSWRIVSGSVDLDVTEKVRDTPSLSWNSLGGCEVARVKIDLPLSTFPDLNEQSRLIVTDPQGRGIWEGYCTDPGGVDDDSGEAFDLLATGSMVLASDRVEPLVYRDAELSSWTRTTAGTEAGQASTYDDTSGTGWLVAHPQGYAIGTGASVGIEYRALEHASQSLGAVTFTVAAGAADPGFVLRVTTYNDGVLVNTLDYALATPAVTRTLVAGTDFTAGVDVIAINLVRAGGATNVTTGLAYVRLTGLAVAGSRVDRFGAAASPTAPLTSRAVIEDLIGRGMLAQVDPHRAVVDDSAALHTQLAFPEGTRGAGVISKVREIDPDMVWMYGSRAAGGTIDEPGGHDFSWTAWPATEVRYDLTEADTVSRPGGDDGRCHRISVFYRESETGPLKRVVVQLADPGGGRLRDADPINLGIGTQSSAIEAGQSALDRLALTGSAGTATVARLILDRSTGMQVEPWEIRPGALARVQASSELFRVTEVSCDAGEAGASATLTLGDPTQTLEDRVLSFLRGESDPLAPLIQLPPTSSAPPVPARPGNTDGQAPTESPALTWRPGFGSVFLTWTPIANPDTVTYRVLIGTSPALVESPSTLAGRATGDFFVARTLPNGTAFVNGTTYYARLIAEDLDGSALAGPVASGTVIAKITDTEISPGAIKTPQLDTNALTTDLLLANDAWIGALRATNFTGETITGPIIRTSAFGQRMEIRSDVSAGVIYGYTGHPNETAPAIIDPKSSEGAGNDFRGRMLLSAPNLGSGTASIELKSGATATSLASSIEIIAATVSLSNGVSTGPFGLLANNISAGNASNFGSFRLRGVSVLEDFGSGRILKSVTLDSSVTGTFGGTTTGTHSGPSTGTHSGPSTGTHSGAVSTSSTANVGALQIGGIPVISSSRLIQNVSISANGAITTSLNVGASSYTMGLETVINGSARFVGSGGVNTSGAVSGNGITSSDLNNGGNTAAEIGNSGLIKRATSSARYKTDIHDLELDLAALKALPRRQFRRLDDGDDGPVYPGVVAEEAHELGLTKWVTYDRDGRPDGFRYAELSVAVLALALNLDDRLSALEAAA